jgi:hypothetical protein
MNETKSFTTTQHIALERGLYTVTQKISQYDIDFFKQFIKNERSSLDDQIIDLLVAFMNDDLGCLFSIVCENNSTTENLLNQYKNEILNNPEKAKTQEILCTMHENDFYIARDMILSTNSLDCLYPLPTEFENPKYFFYLKLHHLVYNSVLRKMCTATKKEFPNIVRKNSHSKSVYYDLFFYVIFQEFRTSQLINLFDNNEQTEAIKLPKVINIKNILFLMLQFQTIQILTIQHLSEMRPVLIENNTNIPFITSDKPSINLYGKLVSDPTYIDAAIELYFPLSKDIAILYSARECYKNIRKINIASVKDIQLYNQQIFHNADKYIFSSNANISNLLGNI